MLAMCIANELEDSGYHVLDLATRHQEALEFARAGRPDLALVNIELDQGDDGVALAKDLGELKIPVMFISGQAHRARAAMAFCIASIVKPYSAADVVEAVDYLFRHRQGDETRPGPAGLEMFDPVARLA